MKQVKLGRYLGIWKHSTKVNTKYYSVFTEKDRFVIRWGKTLAELENKKEKILINDSPEVFKRILSKVRGGYVKYKPLPLIHWNRKCHDEFGDIDQLIQLEKEEAIKRKPRIRKLSLLEWVGGKDEYRENDQT